MSAVAVVTEDDMVAAGQPIVNVKVPVRAVTYEL